MKRMLAYWFWSFFFVCRLHTNSAVASTHSVCSVQETDQIAESRSASLMQTRGVRARHLGADGKEWKLVYGIFTSPTRKYAEQLEAVLDTWAKDVVPHQLLVVGVNGSAPGVVYKPASQCQDGNSRNPGLACKEATMLAAGYEMGADWVLVFGSDNYVFAKRFADQLRNEDANIPQIRGDFGCGGTGIKNDNTTGLFCDDRKLGLCGGAGYAISRAALEKMIGKAEHASAAFVQEMIHVASTTSGNWSDQTTSCVARRRGIEQVYIKGLYGWMLCDNGMTRCTFDEKKYRGQMMNPKLRPLVFHYMKPDSMYKVHRLNQEIGEVKPVEENLPLGWKSNWDPVYMRLYYVNRDLHISTWTSPPTEAAPDKGNKNEQRVSDEGQQPIPTSFLQTSATDDGYGAERARYIQMVDKERSEMDRDSFEQRRAAYMQLANEEGNADVLLDTSQEAVDNEFEKQRASYISMVDKQRAAMLLSAGSTVD